MTGYVTRIAIAPKTLTHDAQEALLRITGAHRAGFRDHVIYAMALGTGLRAHEILALNVGDILNERGQVRHQLQLRVFKRSNRVRETQRIVLPKNLRVKLARYISEHHAHADQPDAALFISRRGTRLSDRQLRTAFQKWQKAAGIERPVNFHGLRHSACTAFYTRTRDIRLTQRFARHLTIESTMRYSHPSEEDFIRAVMAQPC